jgi:hypothetical protein
MAWRDWRLRRRLRFAPTPNQMVRILSHRHQQKGLPKREPFLLAETEGFEPSVPNYQYDGLANRWFQPLTHVSALVAGGAIATGNRRCNPNIVTQNTPKLTRPAPY